MRLKPKLLNAIILGLTMFLSMQTTCAACNPSMAIQQKKVATVGKRGLPLAKESCQEQEENLSQGFGA